MIEYNIESILSNLISDLMVQILIFLPGCRGYSKNGTVK